ncbi:MAG: methionine gamma-lyase family protein [Candidatus Eremiobacterota bacterium]
MIFEELLEISKKAEHDTKELREKVKDIEEYNQLKVLKAFISRGVSDFHFSGSSGYGYHDSGRDLLDEIYAEVFGGEKALVRWQFVSGTHAISSALFGILRPGDEFLAVTGTPYDTLGKVIGLVPGVRGTLTDWRINYREVPLRNDGNVDIESFERYITKNTKLAFIQRSRGYCWRKSLTVDDISPVVKRLKEIKKDIIILVDNCYGEFTDKKEPLDSGADIIAGSLIKNPGGGICPTGGYIAGREDLVELAAGRLTAPGIGSEVGTSMYINRTLYQGLYLAPLLVSQALSGMIWAGSMFEHLNYITLPARGEKRGDTVQAVRLGSKEKLIKFCQGIQSNSPVDSYVNLEGGYTPGYSDKLVMAAGTFIQGASLELSADGPLREPFIAYLQGGLSYFHIKYAVLRALEAME